MIKRMKNIIVIIGSNYLILSITNGNIRDDIVLTIKQINNIVFIEKFSIIIPEKKLDNTLAILIDITNRACPRTSSFLSMRELIKETIAGISKAIDVICVNWVIQIKVISVLI